MSKLGDMLRAWVSKEEAEGHSGAPPGKKWAAEERKEHGGATGKKWSKEEAAEMLGKGEARRAGNKLMGRREAIEQALDEATK